MMKKILLLAIFSNMLFQSCVKEPENIFDGLATSRVQARLDETRSILNAAPNGWIMQYYPDETQQYGGFVILMAFSGQDNVTLAGEVATPDVKISSLYTLKNNGGPMINFDTYNYIIHVFSDPDPGQGQTYNGDFEFSIMSVSQEKIVLKGKKTNNTIVMTPMPAGKNWQQYLEDVIAVEGNSEAGRYKMERAGVQESVILSILRDKILIATYKEAGETKTKIIPYVYLGDGMSFYEPFMFAGVAVQNFKWDNTQHIFKCFDTGVSDCNIKIENPEGYLRYIDFFNTDWNFKYKSRQGNIVEKQVRIVKDVTDQDGRWLMMEGLTFPWYFLYNTTTGGLKIRPEEAGLIDGQWIVTACWEGIVPGRISVLFDGASMVTESNGDLLHPTLSFVPGPGVLSWEAKGIVYWIVDVYRNPEGEYIGPGAERYTEISITKL